MTEMTLNFRGFIEQYVLYPWENFRLIDLLDWFFMTMLFYLVYMLFRGRVAARMGGGLLAILGLSILAEQMGMSGLDAIMSVVTP